eukprot:TRINITY_DN9932_c0_g1_i4.p1 TRINITY_DN9932_c0_g1~~TRINITY_DN9932_c0_g1_i4.p1  ORF type:complete len:376 (+),score=33.58 TRINITY_DN9932_c0_g1_i4:73-1200(+)
MARRVGWFLQRRLLSEASNANHQPKALAAKAEIDNYCGSTQNWSDPWTPCLTKHPPTPLELGDTVSWSSIGHSVIEQCNQLIMAKERFTEVMEVRQRIEDCLKEQLSEREFKLFTFGSCMSGLSTQASDLDLSIMRYDQNGKSLNPVTRDEMVTHLNDYEMMLQRAGFTHLKQIPARVPILRREGPEGVNFDITLFFHGVRNSLLLREYARSCPYFMPMSITLREWTKYIGITNSAGGFLTPYCINIMIIKYIIHEISNSYQVKIPPLLPPAYYPTYPSQYLSPPWEMVKREKMFVKSLGVHIAGFLRFYACFPYLEKVISAADPIFDERSVSPLWSENKSDVIIEEMFSQQDQSLPIPNMAQKVCATPSLFLCH